MFRDRRLLGLLLVVAVIGAPAVLFRFLCVGRACERPQRPTTRIPFCSLPPDVRSRIAAGFRDGRSPDLLVITSSDARVRGATHASPPGPPWPSVDPGDGSRVPLVFVGTGIAPGASVPAGTTLDAVAPTVAELIGLKRPHPEVRSGRPVPGVAGQPGSPRLVVEVVWKGVGSADLEAARGRWPTLRGLRREGAGTLGADVASLPLDPPAVLATIGTGGLPRQHGITGATVRNDAGEAVEPWGPRAPFSVIATLGDDLDELLGQEPRVGLVATAVSDRGSIGGNWYLDVDRDDLVVVPGSADGQARAAERLLGSGYGADEVPDLLVVTMDDRVERMDEALGSVVDAAQRVSRGSVAVVVTSTGSASGEWFPARRLEARLARTSGAPPGGVEALAAGGLFLDPQRLADAGVTEDQVVRALREVRGPDGEGVVADAFDGIAVTLAKYC